MSDQPCQFCATERAAREKALGEYHKACLERSAALSRACDAEANVAKMREPLEECCKHLESERRRIGASVMDHERIAMVRDALASVPAESVSQDRKRSAAHSLAMMALQSERYGNDPDYRDATDNVLAWTMPAAMSANSVRYEQQREELAKKIGDLSEEKE